MQPSNHLSSTRRFALAALLLTSVTIFCLSAAAQEQPVQPEQPPVPPQDTFPEFKPYDPEEALKRRQELTALSRELQDLLRAHPEVSRKHPEDFVRAQLKVEKCALLYGRYTPSTFRDEVFKKELETARSIIRALAAGEKPVRPDRGLIELAYLSDVDRSPQPYYIYVPGTTDLDQPAPLLIFLHGYVGNVDKVNWLEQLLSDSMKNLTEKLGGILLVPFARSNTDFLGIGERDVLHTIELAKRDYRIDADRIYLCGASMGGSGAWAIGAHYPHLFAAVVPASGRSDYNLWQNVARGPAVAARAAMAESAWLTPFKQFIVDRDYAITLKPNFRSLPVFAFHGEDDWLVQPDQSRLMVKALKGLGFEALYEEFPRGDHWTCFDAFDSQKLTDWLRTKRRLRWPERVTYRTYHPRFNRAYWVTIDDFAAFGEPAEIAARRLSPTLVAVVTENVARFTLDAGEDFLKPDRLRVLLADGRTLKPTGVDDGRALFTLVEVPQGQLRKREELCGPIYEAYQRPFVLVHGTAGAPEAQIASQNLTARAAIEWFEFAAGVPRIKKDSEVTDDDIRRFNLILFGTPESNRVIQRIAPKLPVGLAGGKFVVGGKSYEGEGLGFAMIYPNPLNPERYVAIFSGVGWGKGLPKNHKLDFLPDFIVFDDTVGPVSGTNNFKVAGFFDINWKPSETLTWEGPEKTPPPREPELPDQWNEPWKDLPPEDPQEMPRTP